MNEKHIYELECVYEDNSALIMDDEGSTKVISMGSFLQPIENYIGGVVGG